MNSTSHIACISSKQQLCYMWMFMVWRVYNYDEGLQEEIYTRWDYNCDENLYDEDPIACYESCMKISRRIYIQRIQIFSPSNSIFWKMTMLILFSNS